MNGYIFTERVRKLLERARHVSARRHNDYVAPEHLTLSLLDELDGVAKAILDHLAIDRSHVRAFIDEVAPPGTADVTVDDPLPYTTRAKKALELSMQEAKERGHTYVGTEHLLLGVLRDAKSKGAMSLTAAGLTVDAARAEMMHILGPPPTQ